MIGYRAGFQSGGVRKAEKKICEWGAVTGRGTGKCVLEGEDPIESIVGRLKVANPQYLAADFDTVLSIIPGRHVTQVVTIDGKNDRIEMAVAHGRETRDGEAGEAFQDRVIGGSGDP